MSEIESYWINNSKQKIENELNYINWFDSVNSFEEYLSTGHVDFFNRILTIDMYKYLGNPIEKNSLEIGFGGGRLICAATNVFKHSYGIDIIDEDCMKKTEELIKKTNKNNFTLLHRKNIDKIPNNSIDFVYSFIVFQHFSGIDEVINYLKFIKKVLKKSGCGILYFGKNNQNNQKFISHKKLENQRGCALYLNEEYAKELMIKDFKLIEVGRVTKKPWNDKLSGQFFIKFRNK